MNRQTPSFSIVIPTFERNQQLLCCIKSVLSMNYPKHRFEVIVVDDGSKISVGPVLSPYFETLNLTLLVQDNKGPASARNFGAASAKGEYLAFLDDDCAVDPNWLRCLALRAGQKRGNVIGGLTVNRLQRNPYSYVTQMIVDYLYSRYNANAKRARFLTSNNLAVPAVGFAEVGGFDKNMPFAGGEDREFCDRWIHNGYSMTFAPEVVVYHCHNLNLPSFCRQHFDYGRGSQLFHRTKLEKNLKAKHLEPLSFYLGLLAYPLRVAKRNRILALLLLMVLSQSATALGFGWEYLFHERNKRTVLN